MPLREWLRDNLHQYGRKFTPAETLERASAGRSTRSRTCGYLTAKVDELYGV